MASSASKCGACLNKANPFCYVCGDFTTVAQRSTITFLLRTAYFHYFYCKIGDQDKSWAPHICCKFCYNGLTAWFHGKKAAFNFAVRWFGKSCETTQMIVIFVQLIYLVSMHLLGKNQISLPSICYETRSPFR